MTGKSTTCGFSGYRPTKFDFSLTEETPQYRRLMDALRDVVSRCFTDGYRTFLCGMAPGFDLLAGSVVARIKNTDPQYDMMQLLAMIPYEGFVKSFDPYWKRIYFSLLAKADRVVYTSKEYEKGCYYLRDREIVEHSSRLVCYYDGKPGGTAYTVSYALQKGITVMNIADTLLLP